jgi:hypothetical protein
MTANARASDPQASHNAARKIEEAKAKSDNPEEVSDAVKACCQMGRNFTGSEIEELMKFHHPGPNKKSGSICSPERIRGVLSELKKSGRVVPLELEGERGVYRWNYQWVDPATLDEVKPVVESPPVKTHQTSMFD